MPQIECRNLSLAYENHIVVSDLNFDVNAGEYICIVGENGSGKSTLVRALLGLKSPSSGSIRFGDGLSQNTIGYLPQQSSIQRDFPASVREIVLSGCRSSGFSPIYSRRDHSIANENLERLGISDLAGHCYRELSGGQQQRVLLARCLCAARNLILLDEPTAGLDPTVTAEFYHLIAAINRDGMTVIMVSHDIPASLHYASHILHIARHPLFFGVTADYVKSEIGSHFIEHFHGGDVSV